MLIIAFNHKIPKNPFKIQYFAWLVTKQKETLFFVIFQIKLFEFVPTFKETISTKKIHVIFYYEFICIHVFMVIVFEGFKNFYKQTTGRKLHFIWKINKIKHKILCQFFFCLFLSISYVAQCMISFHVKFKEEYHAQRTVTNVFLVEFKGDSLIYFHFSYGMLIDFSLNKFPRGDPHKIYINTFMNLKNKLKNIIEK